MKLLISLWRTPRPPSFVTVDDETSLMFAKMPALSLAWTSRSPATFTSAGPGGVESGAHRLASE